MRACLQYGILVSAVSGAALFFLSDFFRNGVAARPARWAEPAGHGPATAVFLPVRDYDGYYTACSRIRQLVGIEIAERLVSVG